MSHNPRTLIHYTLDDQLIVYGENTYRYYTTPKKHKTITKKVNSLQVYYPKPQFDRFFTQTNSFKVEIRGLFHGLGRGGTRKGYRYKGV